MMEYAPAAVSFAAGTNELIEFQFVGAAPGTATLRFRDSPVLRELVDANGQTLPGSYDETDAAISVSGGVLAQLKNPVANISGYSFKLEAEPGAQ